MNKYIELKKIIEEFLELRKETRKKKELQESNNISLIYYLYIINCVVYNNEYYKFSNDFSQHIKEEIRKWGKWGYHPKEGGLYDYHFALDSSERDNKEKVEEVRQINIMFGELLRKISKISTEIFEYDIYPF
ncbi:hypothetical protein [Leptotrichia massiliensis]